MTIPRPPAADRPLLALVGAALLWGPTFVATKPLLVQVPPLTLACLRAIVALAILLPVLRRTGRRPARGWLPALLGLTGVVGAIACQNLGLQTAGAADAALILNGSLPVLTLGLSALLLREWLTRRGLAGGLLSLAGVGILVAWGASSESLGASLSGNAWLLLSAAAFALYNVLGRRAFVGQDVLAIVSGSFGYGVLVLVPAAMVEQVTSGPSLPSPSALVGLLYLGGGCSVLAFLLASYALARLEAGRVSIISNLKLVIGIVVAVLLLGEPVTAGYLTGGGLILAGAWLAASGRVPAAPPPTDPTRQRFAVGKRSPLALGKGSGSRPGWARAMPAATASGKRDV